MWRAVGNKLQRKQLNVTKKNVEATMKPHHRI